MAADLGSGVSAVDPSSARSPSPLGSLAPHLTAGPVFAGRLFSVKGPALATELWPWACLPS